MVVPNSPFEELSVAEVTARLQLESHFSFHEYDGDDRIIRHYAADAVIDDDIDLDASFWDGVAGIWAEKDLTVNGSIFNWEIDTPACFLAIGRDARAKFIIIDDHTTIVRGRADARGWKDAEHVEIALPVSSWIKEISPKFRTEFFDSDGDMICPNGNVELVQALLAGREILRGKA